MSKKKKLLLCIIAVIIIVIIGIIVKVSINQPNEKSDLDKVASYLEKEHNEKFYNIKYLGKEQDVKEINFFNTFIELYPIKNSFCYYYKAYSKKENIAFYVYLHRNEKGKETFNDTYAGFLERRKKVENFMIINEELLGDIKEGSSLIEYDGYERLECDIDNLHKVMADVSREKEGYIKSRYYAGNNGDQDLRLIYKINLDFEEFKDKKYTELYLMHRNIRDEKELFDKGEYKYFTDLEIIIETVDGYSIIIKGDSYYTGTHYIECKKGEDYKKMLTFNEDGISQEEDKKEKGEDKTFMSGHEINERYKYAKYKIITDAKYKTLSNDGGSHINVFYQFDSASNTIVKYEDKYVGLNGYEYKEKKLYEKKIDFNISGVLKKNLDDLITKKDVNEKNGSSFYVIEYVNKETKIYNKDAIKKLEMVLKIIDNE